MIFRSSDRLLMGLIRANGFFYAAIRGRTIGDFNVLYDPRIPESTTIGSGAGGTSPKADSSCGLHFGPGSTALEISSVAIRQLRDRCVIGERFKLFGDGQLRILRWMKAMRGLFSLASLTGYKLIPQRSMACPPRSFSAKSPGLHRKPSRVAPSCSLLPSPSESRDHLPCRGEVPGRFDSSRSSEQTYIVDDRNTWYPYFGNMMAAFDLRFRSPQALTVISTGELVSESVAERISPGS